MTEKELLNERFKIVFQRLVEKGEIVKSSREKGMSCFAEKIMGNKSYGHIVRACLKDNNTRTITYAQAKRLVQYYQVNRSYLFEGVGPVFSEEIEATEQDSGFSSSDLLVGSPKSDEQSDKVNKNNKSTPSLEAPYKTNVVFSSLSAFASSTVDVSIHEDSERFYIPGMQGQHVAFYIKGASMSPTIADGDMVICRALEQYERIIENEIYAIITNSGNVMVKRVQKIMNRHRQIEAIKCISDNYLEHDPFTLSIQEVRKLLKVERKLTEVGL